MTITDIKPQQRNPKRDSVFIDGAYAFSLERELTAQLGLLVGQEISPEEQKRIADTVSRREALNTAVRLLAARNYTRQELRTRLKRRKHSTETIDATLAKLTEYKLVDDSRYAEAFARDRLTLSRRGPRAIAADLRRRGVPRHDIDQALAQAGDESEAARALLAKVVPRYAGLEPRQRYRKIHDMLLRRGFSFSVISRVLAEAEKRAFETEDGENTG